MPLISLCMIVKNEESMLARCLDSVRGWVDEIIMVDTGSTDQTVALAQQYGAKVFHHPWENDFSKHRNQSLDYATGDWILILDADEQIEAGHGDRIRQIISESPEDVTKIYCTVRDVKKNRIDMVSRSIRLFRNRMGIHYEGIVHNKIVAPSGKSLQGDIVLYHYGYDLSQKEMEIKFHRTLDLLEKQLAENPNDLFALYNISATLQKRNPQKSIEYGFRLLSLLRQKTNVPLFYINIFYVLAAAFVRSKAIDRAIDVCMEAIHIFPKYVDAYWMLCECWFEKKDYSQVIRYGNQFFRQLDAFRHHSEELAELFVYSYDQTWKVSLRMGLSYIYEDNWSEAFPHLKDYIDAQESRKDAVKTLHAHLKKHHPDFGRIEAKIASLDAPEAVIENVRHPTLSLCMIVKNEEAMLPRCLESVKDFVDEMIVVDTGSTDQTIAIAKQYHAKVYHHPWEYDFSKHRNQSISYATGDWILILDADEMIKPGDGPLLKAAIEQKGIDSIMVPVLNTYNQGMSQGHNNQVRLFQNGIGCRYEGIVHNKLTGYSRKAFHPISVIHFGYDLSPDAMRTKYERTARLLKQRIDDNPEDYVARSQLSANFAGRGMFRAAVEEGLRSIRSADQDIEQGGEVNLWTHFIVSSSLVNLGDLKNAEIYARKALANCPFHLDSLYILSIIYHRLKDWKQLEHCSQDFLDLLIQLKKNPEAFGNMVNTAITESWRIHIARGDARLDRGDLENASKCYALAGEVSPDPEGCHETIAASYRLYHYLDLAEHHCSYALEKNPGSPSAKLEMARIYSDRGNQQEYADTIDTLRQTETDDPAILAAIGEWDLRQGQYDAALQAFTKALEIMPEDSNLHINAALASRYLGRIDEAVSHNRKAISIDDRAIEAFVNLGNIYFDTNRLDNALAMYERAINIDSGLMDALLRIAWLHLIKGDADDCVAACGDMLNNLGISLRMSIDSTGDLAEVFRMIAEGLKKTGQPVLCDQAMEIAEEIHPNLCAPRKNPDRTQMTKTEMRDQNGAQGTAC